MLLWVTTAAWTQRLWTLPEGRLSRRAFSAFKDGVVLLQRLLKYAENDFVNPVSHNLSLDLTGLFIVNINILRYIDQSLCYWTSSKHEDEAPALAVLFGIDARPIVEAKPLDDSMAFFWMALGKKSQHANEYHLLGWREAACARIPLGAWKPA